MRTKLALMTAIVAFTCSFAQETPELNPKIKRYSQKIDSIVVSEKSKMNTELDVIDKNFSEKKISIEEKLKQREETAQKYQQIINGKVDAQQQELEAATKEIVKNSVFMDRDSVRSKNEFRIGHDGVNVKFGQNKKRDDPKFFLRSVDLSVSIMGSGLTSKDEPFNFYNRDSDTRNTIINSSQFALRYEDQIGGFRSPVFYRLGLGMRSDRYVPKYEKVFRQDNNSLFVDDFDRGSLKKTKLNVHYLYMPLDLRFVLNPKYTEYKGVKYLDNKKQQLSLILGVYGGLRLASTNYIKYSNENSRRIVERERMMHGVNDFVFGGKFGISYAGFNLFVQKDFTPAFNDSALLKKKYGLQIGLEIANLDF